MAPIFEMDEDGDPEDPSQKSPSMKGGRGGGGSSKKGGGQPSQSQGESAKSSAPPLPPPSPLASSESLFDSMIGCKITLHH